MAASCDPLTALAAKLDSTKEPPTEDDLRDLWARAFAEFGSPEDLALREGNERLQHLYGCPKRAGVMPPQFMEAAPSEPDSTAKLLAFTGSAGKGGGAVLTIGQLDGDAIAAKKPHPLVPLVRCLFEHPPPVRGIKEQLRVLPTIREAPEREAGRLIAAIGRGEMEAPKEPSLPLYPDAPEALIRRVPLLNMIDATGAPIMARGRGAPLAMRVPLHFLLAMDDGTRRQGGGRLVLTVRELRDALFGPRWKRGDNLGRPDDWQRTRDALFEADASRMALPCGGTARLFALWQEPGDRPRLDDHIVLEVRIPTGAHSGALVDIDVVNELGRISAPKLRAYVGVQSVNWLPGRTRVPNPSQGGRFGWAGDPDGYPVLTESDRRDFAFGVGDTKPRTKASRDGAFENTPGIEVVHRNATDPRTGVRGWRLMPSEAAEAVRRWLERKRRRR